MIESRILVVEDERIVALHLKQQLTSLGYTVAGDAASGEEALRLVSEAHPDLVLMDINIEGEIDGIETAARIPAELDLPVIFLTAYSEEATMKRARGTHPYGYLIKPYSERELHATIQMALERQRVASALRVSEARLSLAIETYELGIADFDPATDTIVASPTLERLVGVRKGSLSGKVQKWLERVLPDELDRLLREVDADIAKRRPNRTHQIQIQRPDGEIRDLRGVRRYFYDNEGTCRRTISIYMDVTDQLRQRAEAEARDARLLELQKELNHVSRLSAMGELAAALAHELNQPLTAVGNSVGAIALMMGGDAPPDAAARVRILHAAHHAESQAVRAGEIVRRLRQFIARGEADTQIVSLEALIDDALALALPNPDVADVEICRQLAPSANLVLADSVQIQQILVNLIRNAVDAMSGQTSPKVLTFTTRAQADMTVIEVADTGPGVSAEVAERLFSPFLSTKSDGMGVGLSICRRIVEVHGGTMWLEPSSDAGAAFRFTLPLIPGEARQRSS